MDLGVLKKGIFRERYNRFLGAVEVDTKIYLCFIPNPGRLQELLKNGAEIYLKEVSGSKRKTSFDLVAVRFNNVFVSIDSRLPPRLFAEAIRDGSLEEFSGCAISGFEPGFEGVRFDIELICRSRCFVETKSCTLVEDGVALFPDAPTERGRKHVEMLIEARKRGIRSVIAIIIQRNDADVFRPNKETDPEFSEALKKAVVNGVEVYAYLTEFRDNSLFLSNSVEVDV